MTIKRSHFGHTTRYELWDGGGLRCVLVFDAGEDGGGPAAWEVLLPDPAGTEDLYGTNEWPNPNAADLTSWLTQFVGQSAAAEMAAAVDADPPAPAGWRHLAGG